MRYFTFSGNQSNIIMSSDTCAASHVRKAVEMFGQIPWHLLLLPSQNEIIMQTLHCESNLCTELSSLSLSKKSCLKIS